MTIRVLLADDQALLRATFRILIESVADMTVVAEAADGQQAVDLTETHRPDVVVMDIRMPNVDGVAATATICARPELSGTRILVLTTFEDDRNVAKALRAGASGFLGKGVSPEVLLSGIRTVAAGDTLLSPLATRALITRFLAGPDTDDVPALPDLLKTLTDREREVMALAAHGRSNAEIAAELFLSPLTVRSHIQRAMTKLDARDRAQLVVVAYRSGLVKPPPAEHD
ncbi:response regulator transcription factor [Streptomyces sp. NBC_00015]|uniref:response regulator transcription factor n=1 Tax=unclassified Streptomyces TaxID=2593676 RepID=UPI00224E6F94|nr:response regulator transcription factor [Streptomyces sp. NBC_00103]MCX5371779.1 response regulator transcription factor [Streptomyces sp. NBC_00103]